MLQYIKKQFYIDLGSYLRLIGKEVKFLYSPRYCNVDETQYTTVKVSEASFLWEGEE